MERFINSGTECIVLMREGNRALILCPNNEGTPYVVPWEHKEGESDWHHGHYFSTFNAAYAYYQSPREFPLKERLKKEIDYAKGSYSAREMLIEAYGRIDMAREMGFITRDEYLELNHSCVAEGINNPEYFEGSSLPHAELFQRISEMVYKDFFSQNFVKQDMLDGKIYHVIEANSKMLVASILGKVQWELNKSRGNNNENRD